MLTWPMDILTKEAGSTRKLIVKPHSLIGRDNLVLHGNQFVISEPERLPFTYPVELFVETKEQGHFHYLCCDKQRKISVFGRRLNVDGEYADIGPDLIDRAQLPYLPPETVLAIELIWPGHPDSSVPTAIKECPEQLEIKALAIPIYKGKVQFGKSSLSYQEGRRLLEWMIGSDPSPGYSCVECHGTVNWRNARDAALGLQTLLSDAKSMGIEGYVLKEKHYDGWWKVKVIRDADVFVTKFNISDAVTRTGLVTSVDVGVIDVDGTITDMGSVSGFDLDEMEKMTKAYEKGECGSEYYHRTLRIIYQEVAAKGKLKHGFFSGWRLDKDWQECSMEQFV